MSTPAKKQLPRTVCEVCGKETMARFSNPRDWLSSAVYPRYHNNPKTGRPCAGNFRECKTVDGKPWDTPDYSGPWGQAADVDEKTGPAGNSSTPAAPLSEEPRMRPHGWHWWYGKSGQNNATTGLPDVARWHVVHCWICLNGGAHEYRAHSAHFPAPKLQIEMNAGTWGPEVIPPERP